MSTIRERLFNNNQTQINDIRSRLGLNDVVTKPQKSFISVEDNLKEKENVYHQAMQNVQNSIKELDLNRNLQNPFASQRILPTYNKETKNTELLNSRNKINDENQKIIIENQQKINNSPIVQEAREKANEASNDLRLAQYQYDLAKEENRDVTWLDKTVGVPIRALKDVFSIFSLTDNPSAKLYKNEDGTKTILPTSNQLKQEKVSQSYSTKTGKLVSDIVYNATKIYGSTVIPGGSAIYWGDMFNDNYVNTVNEGYKGEDALLYATLSTASELVTEKALGGISKITPGGSSNLSKTINKTLSKVMKNDKLRSVLSNMLSEGSEEFVQEYVDLINRNLVLGEKNNLLDAETFGNALYSGLVGMGTGGLSSIGSVDINTNNTGIVPVYKSDGTVDINAYKTQLENARKNSKNQKQINAIDKALLSIDNTINLSENNAIQSMFGNKNQNQNNNDFSKQIDEVLNGVYPQRNMLVVSENTPQVLQDIGLKNLPITMTQKHLKTIMNSNGQYKDANYHNLGVDIVKQLPRAIAEPLNVLKSNTKDDSIVVVTDLADNQERPIIASIKIDGTGRINDIFIDTNVMTSAYGRNNYDKFMQDNIAKGNLLYDIDEGIIKRSDGKQQLPPTTSKKESSTGGKVQFPTISNTKDKVQFPMQGNSISYDNNDITISQNSQIAPLPLPNNINMQNSENDASTTENNISNYKVAQLLDSRPLKQRKGLSEEVNRLYQKVVDKGKYVADLSKKTNNKELYAKYDQMGTARGTAEYSIGVEQVDNNGKKIGKSLIDIWLPITESGKEFDFSMYLLHKHNIDRYKQGKPVFGEEITSEISKNEVERYEAENPEFIEWSKDINKYNKNLLQNMVDAGITSEESQKYYNDTYTNYVRIYRDVTGKNPITMNNGNLKINDPIKTAKGGNQDILPLKDSMAQQTLEVTNAIRRNQFGLELLNVLGNGENVTEYGNEIISKNEDGTYSFTVFKDGKPIKMKIDEGLYESLKPTEKGDWENLLPVRGARKLLEFQRGLITDKNPWFLLRNFFKDLGDAPLNSKYVSKFFPNFARAYHEIATNGEYAQLYKALGGYQQSYFDNDSGLKFPSQKKTAKFIRGIQSLNQAVEMAPRLAEFISTIEAGESLQVAMYNAAEITTNFKRGGDVAKALNRNFSNFLNASIQGFDKQFRNFTGQNGAKGYINLLSKAVIFGVLPSVLNHLLLDDDEDYQDLPSYIKDNYYLFKTSNNNFIRIPKGRVVSIFGNAAYRTIEYIEGDKEAYKGFIENSITNVAPNNPIGSNVLSPFIQVSSNTSWNGSAIVPERLQDLPAEEQFDEKTDELSKAIGKLFNISPKKVNYLLDQYSGVFGDTLLPMFTPQAEYNPFASAFSVNSTINNKYNSDFYDVKDEVVKRANSVNGTVSDKLQSKYLNSVQQEISELYTEKRELQMSDVKDSEKRKLVEKIQSQINEIAKSALDEYKNVTSLSDYGKVADIEYYLNSKNEWTKVDSEEQEELNDLSMTNDAKNKYFKTKVQIGIIRTDETKKSNIKHQEIANLVINSGLSDESKGYLYGKYYGSEETIDCILNSGIKFDEYLKFNSQEFTTDYYDNGEAVTNSRKNKVINYVNNLNLSIPQKALLIKMEYSSFKTYDKKIVEYVNSKNISFLDKAMILKKAGFTSYDKQIINYVNKMNKTKEEKTELLEDLGFTIRNGKVYS